MPSPTHAGGIVVRIRDGRTEILLVRARPAPHDWVLPKGHIEQDETPESCARREVREEAGVEATLQGFLGDDEFTTLSGKLVRAAFFLMRYERDVPTSEERDLRWFALDDALVAIRYERPRELIAMAAERAPAPDSDISRIRLT